MSVVASIFLKIRDLIIAKPPGDSPISRARFIAEDRKATLGHVRIVCALGATLVPTFSILDYFAYPDHFITFAILRVICSAMILTIWYLSTKRWCRKFFRLFTILVAAVPATFIAIMVGISGDPGSPYYAGLSLCIVAVGFVFHWSFREALIVCVSVWLMYMAACLTMTWDFSDKVMLTAFVNNTIFILAKGIVITSGSVAHYRIRVEEFLSRDDLRRSEAKLASKNYELSKTLRELKTTERQLIQSEKMASLGQMSAGIIHEIGNPLNYSKQALFLLKKKIKTMEGDHNKVMDIVGDLEEGTNRIEEIINELRGFSHVGSEKAYELEDSIKSAIKMLQPEIKKSEVEVSYTVEGKPYIIGSRNQISQILINLVTNSIHAIGPENPGKVTIESKIEDQEVLLIVEDNGPGIPEETQLKIFDPFYTTKPVGSGTGLGLSIAIRIIEAHSGTITVESQEGKHTRMIMRFPLAEIGATAKDQKKNSKIALPR